MKKKVIAIIIAIVVIGAGVYFLTPAPLIRGASKLEILWIDQIESDGTRIDVTDRFDQPRLIETLGKYKRSRIPRSFAPYESKLVAYEISTIDKGPWHIILGDINFVYGSGGLGEYEIKDAVALLDEVKSLAHD